MQFILLRGPGNPSLNLHSSKRLSLEHRSWRMLCCIEETASMAGGQVRVKKQPVPLVPLAPTPTSGWKWELWRVPHVSSDVPALVHHCAFSAVVSIGCLWEDCTGGVCLAQTGKLPERSRIGVSDNVISSDQEDVCWIQAKIDYPVRWAPHLLKAELHSGVDSLCSLAALTQESGHWIRSGFGSLC